MAISNYYYYFFYNMVVGGHFGLPKITFNCISRHFRSIRVFFSQNDCQRPFRMTENNFWSHFSPFQISTQLWFFFHQMAAGGHFGWLKITFDGISRQFRSMHNFLFFSQNGCRRPFWMTENHFPSHFSLFQINMQLKFFWIFFHKMAAGSHLGWPKITFDRISRHFRSIHNFCF